MPPLRSPTDMYSIGTGSRRRGGARSPSPSGASAPAPVGRQPYNIRATSPSKPRFASGGGGADGGGGGGSPVGAAGAARSRSRSRPASAADDLRSRPASAASDCARPQRDSHLAVGEDAEDTPASTLSTAPFGWRSNDGGGAGAGGDPICPLCSQDDLFALDDDGEYTAVGAGRCC